MKYRALEAPSLFSAALVEIRRVVFCLVCFFLVAACASQGASDENQAPNILIVLVDDMGWSDIGGYGSEIDTPNLDRLAAGGLRFTEFFNTSRRFPSRATLLTGLYAQQFGMGAQPVAMSNATTLAEVLKERGYRTLMVGKHHGIDNPIGFGFNRYSVLRDGASNHFNPCIQLDNPEPAKNPVTLGESDRWREGATLTLVNLDLSHCIASKNVTWGEGVSYTSSDHPSIEAACPSISLHDSEVDLNHKFTDGGEKTVLAGIRFFDDRIGQMFMQDRCAWLKKHGTGGVVYFMPGHVSSDFDNDGYA